MVEEQTLAEEQTQNKNMTRVLAYSRFLGIALRKSRLLAYSTEVAESLRHTQPKYVKPLYILNFAYIGLDIGYNTYATHKYGQETMVYKLLDLIVFHSFASFILPTATIHSVVKYTRLFCLKQKFSPTILARAPVIAGLGMIPFIIHPIDSGVEWIMDKMLRAQFPEQVQKNLHAYHEETQPHE